ncbi:MAG: type II secretion system protein [Magnetococcales bacterium]|nr:type II secretion system protein [Magnetococcales bacterium]MBF0154896.1 type II secretion system protein [Magnetococcales bacterium]
MEMLIVILIMGILTSMTAPLIDNFLDAYMQERDLNGVTSQGRLAMARMTRELRGSTGFVNPPYNNSTQIQFTPPGGGSTVTYSVTGSTLVRTQDGVAVVLADQVASVQFTSNGNAPPVTLLDIALSLTRRQGGNILFSTSVNPRN